MRLLYNLRMNVFYLDVFLLQNFTMDFLALLGTKRFLRRASSVRRLLLAAALGTVCSAVILLWCRDETLYTLVTHFIINTGMLFVAFPHQERTAWLENWIVVYLAVILLGGLMSWLGRWQLAALIGYGIIRYLQRRNAYGKQIYPVQLKKGERAVELYGYWDSGNQLTDPYTGQGIHILSEARAVSFFSPELDLYRYVPFRSLGETDGMLAVTTVDELTITDGAKKRTIPRAAVGIAQKGLLEDKAYDIILHTEAF
jgi:stage II sporulation protein GA (sporulation sigma-E factor processing peptidase)